MKHTSDSIDRILEDFRTSALEQQSKEDVLETLSIYHEELRFQNLELHRVNQELEKSRNEYLELFMDSPVGYVLVDESGLIFKHNLQAQAILSSSEIGSTHIQEHIADADQDSFYRFLKEIHRAGAGNIRKTEFATRHTDEIRHLSVIGELRESEEDPPFFQLALIDEAREYNLRAQISYLSMHDQLTGLYNRRFLEEELQRLDVERSLPLGILMADLDGLKLVNDAFGHASGDQLLIETANKLKQELRQEDIIARIGGDEFLILLPQTSDDKLSQITARFREACKTVQVRDIQLSVSFGYFAKTKPQQNLQDIIKRAEDRMYKDKLFKKTSQRKELINGILATLHEKNVREENHSRRVSEIATIFARELSFDEELVAKIRTAGLLHDIGKIAIDYSILDKPGRLTPEEEREIRKHSEIGYRILHESSEFSEIADIILPHHERFDGLGYPRGIKDSEIRIESRILSICDAYDAMTSPRPYRRQCAKIVALDELRACAGSQFDPHLIDVFIEKVAPKL